MLTVTRATGTLPLYWLLSTGISIAELGIRMQVAGVALHHKPARRLTRHTRNGVYLHSSATAAMQFGGRYTTAGSLSTLKAAASADASRPLCSVTTMAAATCGGRARVRPTMWIGSGLEGWG